MTEFSDKVAVVTGANKGIGLATVRALCKDFKGDVYLTARNEGSGQTAVAKLKTENLDPKFHLLDIDDDESIQTLKEFLEENYGGIDILINNAGIAYKMDATDPFSEQAEETVKTNFFGTLNVCKHLFPLLRPHARVVNVSSSASSMAFNKLSEDLKERFKIDSISMEELKGLMTEFVQAAKNGAHEKQGWVNSAYGVSKIGVTLMTFIQNREFLQDSREDIVINVCCPGYVATDLTSFKGTKTIDEGAETLVYLALLPPNEATVRGKFVRDNAMIDWP